MATDDTQRWFAFEFRPRDWHAHTAWRLVPSTKVLPLNLTSSYFAAAAELRSVYGANRILLATDDVEAAALCGQRILGFECATQSIERKKFESAELIENRVAQHQEGSMSGSAVALDALADIDMLADTDMFVMLFRSCFARVAYALAMGPKGPPAAYYLARGAVVALQRRKMGKMKMKMGGGGKGKGGGMRMRRNLKALASLVEFSFASESTEIQSQASLLSGGD